MQFLMLELESWLMFLPVFSVLETQNTLPFLKLGVKYPEVDKILFVGFWLIL